MRRVSEGIREPVTRQLYVLRSRWFSLHALADSARGNAAATEMAGLLSALDLRSRVSGFSGGGRGSRSD